MQVYPYYVIFAVEITIPDLFNLISAAKTNDPYIMKRTIILSVLAFLFLLFIVFKLNAQPKMAVSAFIKDPSLPFLFKSTEDFSESQKKKPVRQYLFEAKYFKDFEKKSIERKEEFEFMIFK